MNRKLLISNSLNLSIMEVQKGYDFKAVENKWRAFWEKEEIYKFNPRSKGEIYSVDTPPPTVSGKMHIGHAFSYSQQDFVIRYRRMKGNNVFYPFGTDDNGLATERLIERMKNVKGSKMDRTEFINLCLKTLEEIRPGFVQDWKNIAVSADYSLFYSTIDSHCRKISQKSFLELYRINRIYKRKAPIIFCPNCKTAIAQVEMEDTEKETTLNYIKAKLDTGEFAIYATTRPELHPGCIGISLDENGDYLTVERNNGEKWVISKDAYEKLNKEFPMKIIKTYKGKSLVGKKVEIAFAQQPVIFSHDVSAKTDYGTGIVFYCSYGGLDCVEWLARHPNVKPIHIMDESGVYNKLSPYKGMDSAEARKKILEDLEKKGLLIKKEKLKHAVNVHERCGTDIEYIATEQWFIRYLDLKEKFLDAGRKLSWHPEHFINRFENWVKGLQWDWCISRQRFFGVPFPIWYCKKCKEVILAEEKQLPVDPLKDKPSSRCKCGSNEFIPEKDVLDTWATSSLTPQIAASLCPGLYDKLYPMTLRPQAHDIISFWLFNTLVKSQLHNNVNPWKDVVISGWALDPHGKKMSKSKGNVVEPQIVLDKFGADTLRFWAASSKLGEDLPFQEKELVSGQRTVTKLVNASKFAFMHLEDYDGKKPKNLEFMDKWLLSKLNNLVKSCTESFENYEYSRVKSSTEKFFWLTFCDNYLEIVKDRLYNPDKRGKEARKSSQYVLYTSLFAIVKLFAPIMPYVTEDLYQNYFKKDNKEKSIHLCKWPEVDKILMDENVEKTGDIAVEVIAHVRKEKATKGKSLKDKIKVLNCGQELKVLEGDLKAVTQAEKIDYSKELNVEF